MESDRENRKSAFTSCLWTTKGPPNAPKMCSSAQSQHKKCETNDQRRKKQEHREQKKRAAGGNLQIIKEETATSLLCLGNFLAAIGAYVPYPVAHANGEIALHRRHPHLVVERLFANGTWTLHGGENSKIKSLSGNYLPFLMQRTEYP